MLHTLCVLACFTVPASADGIEKSVASLIDVFRHPQARSSRLKDSQSAIKALTAIGKPAVPQLLDAILGMDYSVADYCGAALLAMPESEAGELIKARWEKVGTADRWKLVPFRKQFDFTPVAKFALECLDSKEVAIRGEAWRFVIVNAKSLALAPAKTRYLKALAGDEVASLRWVLLVRDPVFDAEKEADILIELLKPDSWVAKGDGRVPPPGFPPPEWPDGRNLVAEILDHRKVKRAAPALVTLLAEKGEGKAYFGYTVIPVLGNLGDKDAIPELKRVLIAKPQDLLRGLSSATRLQAFAARSLWQLGDTSGRAFLKEELKHEGWGERRYAAETIARYGTKDEIPLLASVLDDTDWGVKQFASEGLERITGVKNRAENRTRPTEYDAPLWKEWLKKNPQK